LFCSSFKYRFPIITMPQRHRSAAENAIDLGGREERNRS